MQMNYPLTRLRKNSGSQIAEFGPALFVIFIAGLFPMLDLIYIGMSFSCGWYLNQLEAREAAITCPPFGQKPPYSITISDGAYSGYFPEMYTKANNFRNSPLGKFANINETSTTFYEAADSNPATNAGGWAVASTTVTTIISVKPLLKFGAGIFDGRGTNENDIPGLTGPLQFKFSAQQCQEQRLVAGS
jgi:hypothetical protein